ncbi:MAG: adenosylhomocysteinase [Firmicutes bacterium]|nr:adenosylhomocysteinase [Bacillota bacterium]
MSIIRDPGLAPLGKQKIEWAWQNMPILNSLSKEFSAKQVFKGKKIAVSVHLEAKTACLAKTLAAAGAQVAVTGSNPLSTQDAIAAALAEEGLQVFAWHGATKDEYFEHLNRTLDFGPDLIIDDGGDLVNLLHTERKDLADGVLGGCEETTTGIIRLRAMEKDGVLRFPMMAVNDAYCKHLFDNRYGTGQSVWDGIMRTTNLLVAGKTVIVSGYGWCGRGVAMRAKGLGAKVIITEVDAVKALEAYCDGYEVLPMDEAATRGDIFVTTTGCKDIITAEHFKVMKDGAILSNAGHFNVEINLNDLEELSVSHKEVRPGIEQYTLHDGRRINVLGEGRLVNLACGDGHPVEIMDMSFAIQALAIKYVMEHSTELGPKVHRVPESIDNEVAKVKLASLGITIDELSPEQEQYVNSWQVD